MDSLPIRAFENTEHNGIVLPTATEDAAKAMDKRSLFTRDSAIISQRHQPAPKDGAYNEARPTLRQGYFQRS